MTFLARFGPSAMSDLSPLPKGKADYKCSDRVFPSLTPEADIKTDQPLWQTADAE
jgi:hypothetical protein